MNLYRIRSVRRKLLKVDVGSVITVHKITTDESFKAYVKGHVGLNISASHIYIELCRMHWTDMISKRPISMWYKPLKIANMTQEMALS